MSDKYKWNEKAQLVPVDDNEKEIKTEVIEETEPKKPATKTKAK